MENENREPKYDVGRQWPDPEPMFMYGGTSGGRLSRYNYYKHLFELIDQMSPGSRILIVRPKRYDEYPIKYRIGDEPERNIPADPDAKSWFDTFYGEHDLSLEKYATLRGVTIVDHIRPDTFSDSIASLCERINDLDKHIRRQAETAELTDERARYAAQRFDQLTDLARNIGYSGYTVTPSRRGRNIRPDNSKKAKYSKRK